MKLNELNETAIPEIDNFSSVSKELDGHINQIESDLKEVNLNIVKILVSKANIVLVELEKVFTSKPPIITMDKKVSKYTKQLGFLKDKFIILRDKYSDNVFQKNIILDVDKILKDLITKIVDAVGGAEG